MKRLGWLIAIIAFLAPVAVYGQSALLQGGAWTPGHAPMYVGQGGSQPIVQDSGPAGGGPIGMGLAEQLLTVRNPLNVYPAANVGTGPLNTNWCDYDAPINNATGYHFLCLSPNAQGGGLLAYGFAGGATALPFTINVNGTTYPFPGALSQITIGITPVNGGTTGQCLTVGAGGTVSQQVCATSSITSLTGDVTAAGPGAAVTTLATVNPNVGTFGSTSVVPIPTVNAKGLITSVSQATIAIPGTQLTGATLAGNIVSSSLTAVGTIGTGVWQASVIQPTYGGTGINNGSSTLTLGASLGTTGAGVETLAFPASSGFTYTFQNSTDTIVMRNTTDTLTNKTLTSPTINSGIFAGGALSGTFSGTPTLSGANFITNANLVQGGAATLKGNPTNGLANVQDFTLQGLVDITAPNTTLDWIPVYNHTTGTIEKVNAAELTTAIGSGVTSLNTLTGVLTISGVAGIGVSAASTTITVSGAFLNIALAASAGAI